MKIREDNNLSDPVYIGDTLGDFNACRKAGVPFIFAEYGFGQVDKPDYRITRPFDPYGDMQMSMKDQNP